MSLIEILNIAAALIGIIGGPVSVYFSWRAAQRAGQAVSGAAELSRRLTNRELFYSDGTTVQK